jgi:hypothetical protein
MIDQVVDIGRSGSHSRGLDEWSFLKRRMVRRRGVIPMQRKDHMLVDTLYKI